MKAVIISKYIITMYFTNDITISVKIQRLTFYP